MKSEVKKGAIMSYVLLAITNVIALVYTPFLIRSLGQSEYGLYSLINSIIGYLTVLDLGFGNAIVVYTAKYRQKNDKEAEEKLHGMFFLIYIIIGVIAGLIGLVLFLNASNMFGATMSVDELSKAKILLLILTVNLAVTFPFSIYSSIITAYEKFVFQKGLAIARTLLNPLIMLPLLFLGYKSITIVVITTILNFLTLFLNYLYCKKKLNIKIKYTGIDKKLLKTIFSFSFFIFLNVIIDKVNWSLDQFILGAVSGTIAVSVYSVASQFNSIYLSFSTAISGVMLPKITRMVESKSSDEEISDEFVKTGRIQFLILFLIISGYIIFGKDFIIMWAGADYEMAYYIGLLLMIPVTIPLTQNLGISILQAKNIHKFRSVILSLTAIMNVCLSIPLAIKYDGVGSAVGTAISNVIGNIIIVNIYYYKKAKINILKYWSNILKISLLEVIPLSVVLIILNLASFEGILRLSIIPIYVILYSVYTYFVVLNDYEKSLIKMLLNKVLRLKK